MKRKIIAILMSLVLVLSLTACGGGEETTLTGMVVAVEGTVLSVVQMDEMNFEGGEGAQMPENFGDFNPEEFSGTLPEGETFPARGDGERPEMPEGMEIPEGMEMPEGMTMPAAGSMPEFDGEMPDFGGQGGGMFPGFGGDLSDMETTDVDIADAHISLEEDGVKTSGTLEDIQSGSFVTITLNGKGEVTYVLVTEGFGGRA